VHGGPEDGSSKVDPKDQNQGAGGEDPSKKATTPALAVVGINKALGVLKVQVPESTYNSQEDKYKFILIGKFVLAALGHVRTR